MPNDQITLCLRGIFRVVDQDGTEFTPRSKRAKAILGMLADSKGMKRSRRWIEDKLWPPNQVQARRSLRTELYAIRQSLGAHAEILQADRAYVWLDQAHVQTDLDQPDSECELLEGLEINHPEFEDWHRDLQSKYDHPYHGAPSPRPKDAPLIIQCGYPTKIGAHQNTLTKVVDDQVGKIISEFVVSSQCATNSKQADLLVNSSMQQSDDGALLLVQVINPQTDQLIHSAHISTEDGEKFTSSRAALGRMCWDVADRALEKFSFKFDTSHPLAVRSRYTQQALKGVLTFEKHEMQRSLDLLRNAYVDIPSGLFLALEAWAQMSMIMEEFMTEDTAKLKQIKSLLKRAREQARDCSLVSAIIANVEAVLFSDFDEALITARQSLRDNSNNIFALQATAVCRARNGDMATAYKTSGLCKDIAVNSKFEPMCNLYHSLVCIEANKQQEALECSLVAADFAPKYRAPKRQLIALGALNDRPDLARKNANALRKIEPDFDIQRLLHDEAYPSHTLRRKGLLKQGWKIESAVDNS